MTIARQKMEDTVPSETEMLPATSAPSREVEVLVNGSQSRAPQAGTDSVDDLPLLIIEPKPGWHLVDFRELWRHRELLFFLAWRDVKVRYKQTLLGAAWALLQPLATMLVFTVVLGRLAAQPGAAVPYSLFVFAGLLPWTFFSSAINSAAQSVVGDQNLVTKIYFPRLIIPMAAIATALVDFAISLTLLAVLMLCYGVLPGQGMLLAPVIVLLLVLAGLGIGTLLSALTVAYRDFRSLLPYLVQFWMFATPTIYLQSEVLGPRGSTAMLLNPMHGLIYNFRQAILGGAPDWTSLTIAAAETMILLIAGCFYFRRVERSFADII